MDLLYIKQAYSYLSPRDIKEVFYPLTTPQAVTAVYKSRKSHTSISGSSQSVDCRLLYTDAAFWKVFQFRFVAGAPFDAAMVESGIRSAVINETTARKLYGSAAEAPGKRILLNYVEYRVQGVVKDVHKFAEQSYADIWVPYTTTSRHDRDRDGRLGEAQCFMLAYSKANFEKIRREVAANLARYNASSEEVELSIEGPETFVEHLHHQNFNDKEKKTKFLSYFIIISVVLLVPSINLSSMAHSRMKKRLPEIGVRKAFGATRMELMMKVLQENLLITLLGGLVGLVLSYVVIWFLSDWLLASRLGGTASMSLAIFTPWVFVVAFLFCLVINLLIAGIPAWNASGADITIALNE